MKTKWYLKPEAQALLIRAGLGEVEWHSHVKYYVLTRETWHTAEGDVADAIDEFCNNELWNHDIERDEMIARGAEVYPQDAIAFACGEEWSNGVTRPDDFQPILDAIEAARNVRIAA